MSLSKSVVRKILLFDYVVSIVVVITLYFFGVTDSIINNIYGVIFLGFIPIVGGLSGLFIAKDWGLFSSALGRAVVFLSLGLISWGMGTYIFSGIYNLILNVAVPYPSIADIGYILSIPLWIIGVAQLARATGAKYGLHSLKGKINLFIIPALVVLISYYLLIVIARGGAIDLSDSGVYKIFFDLAYPLGDVLILTIATLVYGLSYNYFGGAYKKATYVVLLGFVVMYFADFSFSYTTTLETFYPADWVDFLFTTAVFMISIGVTMLDPKALTSTEVIEKK